MATGPIEKHLHRSFNWENAPPSPGRGLGGGVRLATETAYPINVFG